MFRSEFSGLFEGLILGPFLIGLLFFFWGIARPAKNESCDDPLLEKSIFAELKGYFLNIHAMVIFVHGIFLFWGLFILFGSGGA